MFEVKFLKRTLQFYKKASQKFLSENTVPDYMRRVSVPSNLQYNMIYRVSLERSLRDCTCVFFRTTWLQVSKNDEFVLKTRNCVSKTRNFALQMMNFAVHSTP